MARIPDFMLESVFYLYPSLEAAEKGQRYGGTGFLGSVRSSQNPDISYMYAITNLHNIENGHLVLRINTAEGGFEAIESEPDDWRGHPARNDVAVAPIG